jgi:hypothetical protein
MNTFEMRSLSPEVGAQTRRGALYDLLVVMSNYLDYNYSRADLERDFYYPEGHVTVEAEQVTIRQGLAKLFSGDFAIPMMITELPTNEDGVKAQLSVLKNMNEWLQGKIAVKVDQTTRR